MMVTIHLAEEDATIPHGRIGSDELVKKMVLNPAVLTSYPEVLKKQNEVYEYVIITTKDFQDVFQRLCTWKQTRGSVTPYRNLNTRLMLLEDIVQNNGYWYTGYWGDGGPENLFNDTQCKIRNFIKMAYNNWSTAYILLGGDPDEPIIPYRGLYVSVGSYSEKNIPADLYYSCLNGNWNTNLDDKWGEENESDMYAEVYVGRAPVESRWEANNFVAKTIAYEQATAQDTPYLKKALMIGEILAYY